MPVAYQAAQSEEGDQLGQLSIAETMITQGASVLLVSPQTNSNLEPAMGEARAAGIPVLNVNDAVIPADPHYVGNVQRDNGVQVGKWFLADRPQGGQVAVIEGQAGRLCSRTAHRRLSSLRSRAAETSSRSWQAFQKTGWDETALLRCGDDNSQQHPDLIGFYCNNDTMALGVVEAVKECRPRPAKSSCSGPMGSRTPTPRSGPAN